MKRCGNLYEQICNIENLKRAHINARRTIISTIMSYLGWIGFCDGHNLQRKYVTENDIIQSILNRATEALHGR